MLIVLFRGFSFFTHFPWLQPLVGFADYIGSNLLSNHIIAIYCHCLSPRTMASFHRPRCWLLYFIVFFLPPHGLVQPLVDFADYIGSIFLRNHTIAMHNHCFSPSTMASFHSHHCWLLCFLIILFSLPTDDCDHSLVSLITLVVLCWAITLSLYFYISLPPLSDQLCGITFISDFYSSVVLPYHCRFCLLLF